MICEQHTYGVISMRTTDGTYIPMMDLADMPELVTEQKDDEVYANVEPIPEITGRIIISPQSRKRLMRQMFNWKSRGPLRIKAWKKAWDMSAIGLWKQLMQKEL